MTQGDYGKPGLLGPISERSALAREDRGRIPILIEAQGAAQGDPARPGRKARDDLGDAHLADRGLPRLFLPRESPPSGFSAGRDRGTLAQGRPTNARRGPRAVRRRGYVINPSNGNRLTVKRWPASITSLFLTVVGKTRMRPPALPLFSDAF